MGNFHTEPAEKQEATAPSTGMGHLQGDTQKGTPRRGHPKGDTQKGTPRRGHSKRDTQKGVVPKMLPPQLREHPWVTGMLSRGGQSWLFRLRWQPAPALWLAGQTGDKVAHTRLVPQLGKGLGGCGAGHLQGDGARRGLWLL